MPVSNKKEGGGGTPTTPENSRYGTGFNALRQYDISGAIDDFEDANLSPRASDPEASPLQAWIHEYDTEKAASGRGVPSVASAFARVTYTPAAIPASSPTNSLQPPLYNLGSLGAKASNSPNGLHESPTPNKQPRYRTLLSRNERSPAPSLSPPKGRPDAASLHTPSRDEPSPSSAREPPGPQSTPILAAVINTVDPGLTSSKGTPAGKRLKVTWSESNSTVNTWDSASLTRYWTHDLVRIAILRIMSELNLDFYKDYYRFLDFDGSQQVVQKLWKEIGLVYTEFLRTHVYGLDILTLIAMNEKALNGGPLSNINALLADMICFFAAGKIGMERRAEDMAKALISGGDIINFVGRRCAENGLNYPGGTGRTEERIVQACMQEALLRGGW
ncbi:hypothetical protein L207DRAFT_589379 [Hyaloscypha variabilis F]|uniref:Uncharacterized protein n=1 Tax=Hyaloscypha variabilis (strain UAMH 11265 / GT02V1 / F) TaxID=1149755 RepID=A0A2J6R5M9_HYAVF|nr:hypothetical protein L207DRAFT_589379 [Hyaloscypha variabilis F]